MGDIYHAGEVYAGSVPIDDTQASEETVYSSAKVESMMEEVPTYESITLKSGLGGYVKAAKKNGLINILIKIDSGLTADSYVTVCTLPNKYIPENTFYFTGVTANNGNLIGYIGGVGSASIGNIAIKSEDYNGYACFSYYA